MNEEREIPTLVLASLTTGIMLAEEFAHVHQAAEYILGHSIWTHQFGRPEIWEALREKISAQHPQLPQGDQTDEEWLTKTLAQLGLSRNDPVKEWLPAWQRYLVGRYGANLVVKKGDAREISPFAGIPPEKEVIAVVTEAVCSDTVK